MILQNCWREEMDLDSSFKKRREIYKEKMCEGKTILANSNSFDIVIMFLSNEGTREDIGTHNE